MNPNPNNRLKLKRKRLKTHYISPEALIAAKKRAKKRREKVKTLVLNKKAEGAKSKPRGGGEPSSVKLWRELLKTTGEELTHEMIIYLTERERKYEAEMAKARVAFKEQRRQARLKKVVNSISEFSKGNITANELDGVLNKNKNLELTQEEMKLVAEALDLAPTINKITTNVMDQMK